MTVMEFDDPACGRELADRVRAFIDESVIPVEREVLGRGPVNQDSLGELRAQARERDVYAPQIPKAYGGLGMEYREALPAFEMAGRSLLGPHALRVDAPDEGNMHALLMFGTEEQKAQWLWPLVSGDITSGFSMTEPLHGGGSDPKMLRTSAHRDGDEWVINGHKWWTTNGTDAEILIVMARTDPNAHPYEGCSLFLVSADTPGVEIVREIPHLGGGVTGQSHAEIKYNDVRVPPDAILGELNKGFSHAQSRLGPARLTHCMRFSGMAERALDIAKAYASRREAFGTPLEEKQALRFGVADAVTRLHAVRTMVRHAADRIAVGGEARVPVSMCKSFTGPVVQEVIDTAIQMCGGNGIGKDLPLADFYENVRWFRIVDGADEVHKRVIARDTFRDVDMSAISGITTYAGEQA